MNLRRAAEMAFADEEGWQQRATATMDELDEIIRDTGSKEFRAFHVLGSQGLHFARRAPLTWEERRKLLERLCGTAERGVRLHPYARELSQLHRDLEREYLRLAVEPNGIVDDEAV